MTVGATIALMIGGLLLLGLVVIVTVMVERRMQRKADEAAGAKAKAADDEMVKATLERLRGMNDEQKAAEWDRRFGAGADE